MKTPTYIKLSSKINQSTYRFGCAMQIICIREIPIETLVDHSPRKEIWCPCLASHHLHPPHHLIASQQQNHQNGSQQNHQKKKEETNRERKSQQQQWTVPKTNSKTGHNEEEEKERCVCKRRGGEGCEILGLGEEAYL